MVASGFLAGNGRTISCCALLEFGLVRVSTVMSKDSALVESMAAISSVGRSCILPASLYLKNPCSSGGIAPCTNN